MGNLPKSQRSLSYAGWNAIFLRTGYEETLLKIACTRRIHVFFPIENK